MDNELRFDVVIAGASIGGATAATLLGRAGLKVALLEKSPRPAAYKQVCTHAIQAHATPVMQRLGLVEPLTRAGAKPLDPTLWTRWGHIRYRGPREAGWQVRRETLDPMLRALARDTPGVTFLPGHRVTDLLREREGAGRVVGVVAQGPDGPCTLRAPLVVGADGRHSRVAERLGAPRREVDNERFTYFAYFRNARFRTPGCGHLWLLEPDVAYAFPTDGELSILTVSPHRSALPEFRADLDGAFRRVFARCPDGEQLAGAERVSDYLGMLEVPNVSRPAVFDGAALVGDAAIASDPIWGTGCGFAFVSAAWLADEVAPALLKMAGAGTHRGLDRALARYRKRHAAELGAHQKIIEDASRARPHDWLETLMFRAGVEDQVVARQLDRFGSRLVGPEALVSPGVLARMVWVNLRGRLGRGRTTLAAAP